jgi:hypothetical protein
MIEVKNISDIISPSAMEDCAIIADNVRQGNFKDSN